MGIASNCYEGKPCKTCNGVVRYRASNRCVDCNKKHQTQYYQANRDRRLEQCKEWKQANQESRSKQNRQWYEANRDRRLEQCKEWNRSNPIQRKLYKHKRRASAKIPYTVVQLKERFDVFGNQCVYCLSSENISIDHFLPLSLGGLDALKNLVPACLRCNLSKNDSDPIAWMRRQGCSDRYITSLVALVLQLADQGNGAN